MKLLLNDFIAKNDSMKLHINLIDKVLDTKAKVVWCNKERRSDRYSVGVEFVEMGLTAKEELSNFINKITCS